MSGRVIRVLKESDHKSCYSTNSCQVTVGGKSWRADWTDGTLKMEQLQDRLIAAGADSELVAEFREAVAHESYRDGQDTGMEM